ncbi:MULTISPECIES: FixH family protein [unclassified Paludibacterium]|uniref:FixH family protein n=1 Tax=unclassified Paludibacterium TaxID=2618429 RepID=UPI001C05B935|nr:FixH family protein [Paludibacterium sp. B53371]BEV71497.1 hypothetical protein THUN1379_09790 [Paludibacterium sp. THUN1379]
MTIQSNSSMSAPWYKHRWPWLLIAIPFSSVCVGSYFIYIATHGTDPMVQEQYYAAGQSINSLIEAGKTAEKMGLLGQLTFADNSVTLVLQRKVNEPLPPVLTLQLSHPTIASLDQTVNLVVGPDGRYSAALQPSQASRWDLTLSAPDKRWSLSGKWNKEEGSQATLSPTDVREAQN